MKVLAIALYEAKSLMRTKLFKTYVFISATSLILSIGLLSQAWSVHALPASIPYGLLVPLNILQAIAGLFLASQFIYNETFLNTIDTLRVRSITNAGYIIGKFLGLLFLFAVTNIFFICIALIGNVFFFNDVPVFFSGYLFYFLLLHIPTIVFIAGFSFFSMALFRSSAISYIFSTVFIVVSFLYAVAMYNNLFDFCAVSIPMLYSDFVGFGNLSSVLLQRMMYLLFGIGFIFLTIILYKSRRLPQSRFTNIISLMLAVLCIGGAILLGNYYLSIFSEGTVLRENMRMINKQYVNYPRITITNCALKLIHKRNDIDIEADINLKNDNDIPLGTYRFSLNPGLKIQSITRDGAVVDFQRDIHLVTITSLEPLQPDGIDSLTIRYHGTIDDNACYVDIGETERSQVNKLGFCTIDKRYSFVTPDFVLLTPENLWYPAAGVSHGSDNPFNVTRDFINFELEVKTDETLLALSQGASPKNVGGAFVFKPEYPLPQLSLVIGAYDKKSISVNNVEYNLYVRQGHDYF